MPSGPLFMGAQLGGEIEKEMFCDMIFSDIMHYKGQSMLNSLKSEP